MSESTRIKALELAISMERRRGTLETQNIIDEAKVFDKFITTDNTAAKKPPTKRRKRSG